MKNREEHSFVLVYSNYILYMVCTLYQTTKSKQSYQSTLTYLREHSVIYNDKRTKTNGCTRCVSAATRYEGKTTQMEEMNHDVSDDSSSDSEPHPEPSPLRPESK
jgi:hypothetical protein